MVKNSYDNGMNTKPYFCIILLVTTLLGCEDSRNRQYSHSELDLVVRASYEILLSLNMSDDQLIELNDRFYDETGVRVDLSTLDKRPNTSSLNSETLELETNKEDSGVPIWADVFCPPGYGASPRQSGSGPIFGLLTVWEVCWIQDPALIPFDDSLVGKSRRGLRGVNTLVIMGWEIEDGEPVLIDIHVQDGGTNYGPDGQKSSAKYAKELLNSFSISIPKVVFH